MKTLAITIVLSFAAFSEAQDCTESANPLGECGTCDTKQVSSLLMLTHDGVKNI